MLFIREFLQDGVSTGAVGTPTLTASVFCHVPHGELPQSSSFSRVCSVPALTYIFAKTLAAYCSINKSFDHLPLVEQEPEALAALATLEYRMGSLEASIKVEFVSAPHPRHCFGHGFLQRVVLETCSSTWASVFT